MRASPQRKIYDAGEYSPQFRDVMNKFHLIMSNHHGRLQNPITCREWTVETTYFFPVVGDGHANAELEEEVVLYLSHDADYQFTIHHFGGAADHPSKYKTLKEDIDRLSILCSSKAAKRINNERPENVNIFDEIRKALERLDCIHVIQWDFRHAVKFTGNFGDIKFMFNVYHTAKDGNLQTKKGKKTIVWDRPKEPAVPVILKVELDKVVAYVKRAESGVLTIGAEITAGPNDGNDLVAKIGALNLS